MSKWYVSGWKDNNNYTSYNPSHSLTNVSSLRPYKKKKKKKNCMPHFKLDHTLFAECFGQGNGITVTMQTPLLFCLTGSFFFFKQQQKHSTVFIMWCVPVSVCVCVCVCARACVSACAHMHVCVGFRWKRELDINLLVPVKVHGSGDSSVVRAPDLWLKDRGFESLLERRENFLLQGRLSVLTLISVSVPPPCYHSST